jgi:hypothetical protein
MIIKRSRAPNEEKVYENGIACMRRQFRVRREINIGWYGMVTSSAWRHGMQLCLGFRVDLVHNYRHEVAVDRCELMVAVEIFEDLFQLLLESVYVKLLL